MPLTYLNFMPTYKQKTPETQKLISLMPERKTQLFVKHNLKYGMQEAKFRELNFFRNRIQLKGLK